HAVRQRCELVNDERRRREYDVMRRSRESPHDELQKLVRAVSLNDFVTGDAEICRKLLSKPKRRSVGVPMAFAKSAFHGLDGIRRGTQGVFVRGELDRTLYTELPLELLDRLAGFVGQELFDGWGDERKHFEASIARPSP